MLSDVKKYLFSKSDRGKKEEERKKKGKRPTWGIILCSRGATTYKITTQRRVYVKYSLEIDHEEELREEQRGRRR